MTIEDAELSCEAGSDLNESTETNSGLCMYCKPAVSIEVAASDP